MSKEELLKYLIAEIDLIMHDKDYRFENANGTWYSRESCRDLTNEEVFEELRTELRQFADLEAKLAESEKENKTLKDIRTLERVVPRNAQLNKLSNRDCYLKGFENAISETIRTFEETYGKEKCKLIEERDKYLMDIVKAGGYEYQIEELKQKLAEKEKEIEYQESMKILAVENQNKNAIEQLEQIINLFEPYENEEKDTILCANNGISFLEFIDNQIKQLKKRSL